MQLVIPILKYVKFRRPTRAAAEHKKLLKHPYYDQAFTHEHEDISTIERRSLIWHARAERLADLSNLLVVVGFLAYIPALPLQLWDRKSWPFQIIAWTSIIVLFTGILASVIYQYIEAITGPGLATFDHRVRKRIALLEGSEKKLETSAEEVSSANQMPLLYLRSFNADNVAASIHGWLTEEEQLVKALTRIGALLTVGRPGEKLPEAGARRIYFNDHEWQSNISELIRRARLVIMRAGCTQSLSWEASEVARLASPLNILIVAEDKQSLLLVANKMLEAAGKQRVKFYWQWGPRIGSIATAATFDANWKFRPLSLKRNLSFEYDSDGPHVRRFESTLQPIIRRFVANRL